MSIGAVSVIAAARQKYRGRWYSAGEEFIASEVDAKELIALGFVRRAPDEKSDAARRRTYKRRDLRAE